MSERPLTGSSASGSSEIRIDPAEAHGPDHGRFAVAVRSLFEHADAGAADLVIADPHAHCLEEHVEPGVVSRSGAVPRVDVDHPVLVRVDPVGIGGAGEGGQEPVAIVDAVGRVPVVVAHSRRRGRRTRRPGEDHQHHAENRHGRQHEREAHSPPLAGALRRGRRPGGSLDLLGRTRLGHGPPRYRLAPEPSRPGRDRDGISDSPTSRTAPRRLPASATAELGEQRLVGSRHRRGGHTSST